MSTDEILAVVAKDEPFFRNSGGGLTLSGGEPTLHLDFCVDLARKAREQEIHVLLETCGLFAWEHFAQNLLPHLNAVYFDLKLYDDEAHLRFCGVHNIRILDNFRRLLTVAIEYGMTLLPRIPLVPEITATEANLRAWAAFLLEQGVQKLALLPYNPTWHAKARGLGAAPEYENAKWMTDDDLARCLGYFAELEIL